MEKRRFLVLDGLRGVAAIAVMSRHLPPYLADQIILPESYLAVDLFFVLSGFILAHSYEQRLLAGMSVGEFMRIRIIRLGPLYWLAGILAFAEMHRIANPAILNLLFLPAPSYFHVYSLNFPAWSLGCELVANAIFAAFIHKFRGNLIFIPISIGLAGMVAASVVLGDLQGGPHWSDMWVGYDRVMFSFFLGVLIYRKYQKSKIEFSSIIGLLLPFALLGLFNIAPSWSGLYDIGIVTLVFPLIVWLGAGSHVPYRAGQIMGLLGAASYGVYVLQIPLRQLAVFVVMHLHIGPSIWVSVLFCIWVIASAIFLDQFFDTPARRWLMARTRRTSPINQAAVGKA
jgi:peptidoglycan/LPS O-acetylase OafA/YrhL